jgi:hypothetical protein
MHYTSIGIHDLLDSTYPGLERVPRLLGCFFLLVTSHPLSKRVPHQVPGVRLVDYREDPGDKEQDEDYARQDGVLISEEEESQRQKNQQRRTKQGRRESKTEKSREILQGVMDKTQASFKVLKQDCKFRIEIVACKTHGISTKFVHKSCGGSQQFSR